MRTLLHGATVWAGPDCTPAHGWVLLDGDAVADTGTGRPPVTIEADRTVDLTGRHLLPGFVDVHSHLSSSAFLPAVGDAAPWTSLHQAIAAIAEDAAARPHDPWLMYMGADPHNWPERRLPTAAELDAATGGRPVTLACVDIHRGAVSSAALEALGLGRHSTTIGHPEDVVRGRGGRPTGEVYEAVLSGAVARAQRAIADRMGDSGVDALLDAEAARHLALGITHAHDPGVDPATHQRLASLAARTSLGLSWAAAPRAGLLHPAPGPAVLPDGPYGAAGREVKIFTDGADRCALCLPPKAALRVVAGSLRNAARSRSLAPLLEDAGRGIRMRPGHLDVTGLRYTDRDLTDLVSAHADAGNRVRIHALGNLAVEQVTRALRAAEPDPGAATVEHVTLLTRREADLLARTGAWVSFQPGFLPGYSRTVVGTGVDRHLQVLGGRTLLDAGCRLVLSSDQPCGPLDPLHNVRAAVHRLAHDGRPLQPGEALTTEEAVRAATTTAARSLGLPQAIGISPGAPADLAVLDGDPTEAGSTVERTYKRGG